MKIKISKPAFSSSPRENYIRSSSSPKAISILISVFSTVIVLVGYKLSPAPLPVDKIFEDTLTYAALFFAVVLLVFIIHEIIHVMFSPKGFNGRNAYIGIYPRGFMCYAYTEEAFTKKQCLICLLSPFMILSIVPFIAMLILGKFNGWLYMCTIVNFSISTADIIISFVVIRLVPSNALDVQPSLNYVDYLLKP